MQNQRLPATGDGWTWAYPNAQSSRQQQYTNLTARRKPGRQSQVQKQLPRCGSKHRPPLPGPEPWPCCYNNQTRAKKPAPVMLEACMTACSSDNQCTAIATGPFSVPPAPPPAPRHDQCTRTNWPWLLPGATRVCERPLNSNDPSDNYMNAPAIWPKHIGYGCNRTLGCPGWSRCWGAAAP
jgi:hypothetical protein